MVEDDPEGVGKLIRIEAVDAIPAALVLGIGDAVHNLKAALDYTISELLGWQDTRLTFPMGETREELETSFRTNGLDPCPKCGRGGKGKGRNAAIEIAIPGFGRFLVDEIRPYKAADGFLWPLNKLDVRDKHRLLIPVMVPQALEGIKVRDDYNNRLTLTGRFEPGGIVRLAHMGNPGVVVEDYGKATAEILFNEVGVIERKSVMPTLVNMFQAVAQTIDRIEEFVIATGWTPAQG